MANQPSREAMLAVMRIFRQTSAPILIKQRRQKEAEKKTG